MHDDRAQARDGADLHGVCASSAVADDAPGRRPTTMVSPARAAPGMSSAEQGDEGDQQAAGAEGHGGSVAEVCVTAQARGVPDV